MISSLSKFLIYELFSREYSFESNARFSYIFHVEKIHDDFIYKILLSFVKSYLAITNKKCILTIMTPENYLIAQEMADVKCNELEYIDRVNFLSEYATIGYHGHFYSNSGLKEINKGVINDLAVSVQFDKEVEWLERHFPSYKKIYSAGWWYMSDIVIRKLNEYSFEYDFSFSYSPYFGCDYSKNIMSKHRVKFGEAFTINNNPTRYIQNFIGCHDSKYPQDFIRRFNNLKAQSPNNTNMIEGVINNHDFNLANGNDLYTLKCIERIVSDSKCKIIKYSDFGLNEKNIILTR